MPRARYAALDGPVSSRRTRGGGAMIRMSTRLACGMLPGVALLCACSFNNYGVVAAHVTTGDGAQVVDIHRIGLGLRTYSADSGLSLGYAKESYGYAAGQKAPIPEGWYLFRIPFDLRDPLFMHLVAIGAELRWPGFETGLSLGGIATTLMANVPADQSVRYTASFEPARPAKTFIRFCKEESTCTEACC